MATRNVDEAESYSVSDEYAHASIEMASDEFPTFVCHPCSKRPDYVAAKNYCVDCGRLLCDTCLSHHNKFDFMNGHQVTNAEASKDYGVVPTIRCDSHPRKIIDMYCKVHETPCCASCISQDHSSCVDKDSVRNVAKGFINSPEYQQADKLLEKKIKTLKEIQRQNELHLDNLDSKSKESLAIVSEKHEEIEVQVNSKLEQIRDEIKQRKERREAGVKNKLSNLKENIKRMEANKIKLEKRVFNDSDAFIVFKTIESSDANHAFEKREINNAIASLELVDNQIDMTVFESLKLFGQLPDNREFVAVFHEDYPIKTSSNGVVCCITDSCLMDNGQIILADQNNSNIKKIGLTFQVEDSLPLSGKPGAVCQTIYPEVAIPLLGKKIVQFASVESPMTLTRSFSIGESCRGVAFSNSTLYLSCGGMQQFKDGPGEIRVYDHGGDLCRKYTKLSGKRLTIPKRAVTTASGVYVADAGVGILGIEKKGVSETGPYEHKDMMSPMGICSLTEGILIVCGYESHNVMLLYTTDGSLRTLIGKDQELRRPKSVCMDSTGRKLIVCLSDKDYIKVFDLKQK